MPALSRICCLVYSSGRSSNVASIKAPKIKFEDYAYKETRYKMLTKSHPEHAKELLKKAQEDVDKKWKQYKDLSELNGNDNK